MAMRSRNLFSSLDSRSMSCDRELHLQTQILSDKYTFKWTIDNFSKLLKDLPVTTKTVLKPFPGVSFTSTFEKKSFYLLWSLNSVDSKEMVVRHQISVVDKSNTVLLKKAVLHKYSEAEEFCILLDQLDEFTDFKSLKNDQITLVVRMIRNSFEENKLDDSEDDESSTESEESDFMPAPNLSTP